MIDPIAVAISVAGIIGFFVTSEYQIEISLLTFFIAMDIGYVVDKRKSR